MADQAMGAGAARVCSEHHPDATAYSRLSEAQATALRGLAAGKPLGEAAAAAGVDRGTLYRWRTQNPDFIDALFEWRDETHAYCRDRMLSIADKAIGAVETGLEKGDARLAFRLLLDINRKTPQEREEQTQRREERRKIEGRAEYRQMAVPVHKLTPEQLRRMPEMLEEIREIDNAREKLEPGQYIVIEHKSPPGAFVVRSYVSPVASAPSDVASTEDAPADHAPREDAPSDDVPSDAAPTDNLPADEAFDQ